MSLVIFDFDGTIANSLTLFIEATNCLAPDFGYSPLSSPQVAHLRTLGIQEVPQELGIPKWKWIYYLQRFRRELTRLITDLEAIDGIEATLLRLHEQGDRLGIVTANSRRNVEYFLNKYEIAHLFEFIYGGRILFGKTRTLKKLAILNSDAPSPLVYIGDEINDIKAAKQAGLRSIAVGWGFNDRAVLAQQTPDFLVDCPEQIMESITQVWMGIGSI